MCLFGHILAIYGQIPKKLKYPQKGSYRAPNISLVLLLVCFQLVSDLRKVYGSGRTRSVEWRKQQIRGLVRIFEEEEEALCDALYKDLHKVCVHTVNIEK